MKKFILICLNLLIGSIATGQSEKMVLPSDLKQQTVVTEPITLRKGYFRAGTRFTYIAQDKHFKESGGREYWPYSSWSTSYGLTFSLSYGITDRIQISLFVPLDYYHLESYYLIETPLLGMDYSLSINAKGRGLGDCNFMIWYQVIPEKEKKISLTVGNHIITPTGQKNFTDNISTTNKYGLPIGNSYNIPTGEGCVQLAAMLLAKRIHYPYSYSAFATYTYSFWGSKLMRPDYTSENRFKKGNNIFISCSFDLLLNDWIAFENQFNYSHTEKGKIEYEETVTTDPSWDICYSPSLIFQIRRFRISEIVLVPLLGKNTNSDPAYSLSVGYIF
jgi:hypothetical protein